jgi:hypothetical protein
MTQASIRIDRLSNRSALSPKHNLHPGSGSAQRPEEQPESTVSYLLSLVMEQASRTRQVLECSA